LESTELGNTIRAKILDGCRYTTIAAELGCSKSVVTYHAQRIGAVVTKPPLPNWAAAQVAYVAGASKAEIRERFHISDRAWRNARKTGLFPNRVKTVIACCGQNLHPWSYTRKVRAGRYIYVYLPEHPKATKTGYVYEHRVVLENTLGRLLEDNEVAHHVNENKFDNLPENLQVMTRSQHMAHHSKRPTVMMDMRCEHCGRRFTREARNAADKKGAKHTYCSKRCCGLALNGRTRKNRPR
jgi:hypothetical protein